MASVVKQYGEIRTGTNYLRALVLKNYPEVLLLTYILGDKHAPPVPFEKLWREALASPDAALEFTRRATYYARGPASYDGDPSQLAEITKRAAPVAEAYASRSLSFVVTIKDPYAWIVSVARFQQWVWGDGPLQPWDLERVRDACEGYNRKYRAWFTLAREEHERTRVIRYEELLTDPDRVLAGLGRQFGLKPAGAFAAISATVEPTVWDHLPINTGASVFDTAFYTERRYLERLPAAHRGVIEETIEWELFAPHGYAPLSA